MHVVAPQEQLPNAEFAVVPAAKVRDYLLNPSHPQGGPKARVFAAVLGLTRDDWRYLRDQLRAGAMHAPALHRETTTWGELFEVRMEVQGHEGRAAVVRTGWIIRSDDHRPHLTTAYVDLP